MTLNITFSVVLKCNSYDFQYGKKLSLTYSITTFGCHCDLGFLVLGMHHIVFHANRWDVDMSKQQDLVSMGMSWHNMSKEVY